MLQRILTFFERYSFGVCTYLGEKFNISITKIRLFFYLLFVFLAVGFPLVILLFCRHSARHTQLYKACPYQDNGSLNFEFRMFNFGILTKQ